MYEKVKNVDDLICFALGIDSFEGENCCVSRAYAVSDPILFENPLLLLKKRIVMSF